MNFSSRQKEVGRTYVVLDGQMFARSRNWLDASTRIFDVLACILVASTRIFDVLACILGA